ncbi:MAG TPA: DUF4142 domain-containing protein [Thermoanaerobaculia bacterium]|nr:DUF4142 domain-containing protein [Thermoanaerobaculia bacterium]
MFLSLVLLATACQRAADAPPYDAGAFIVTTANLALSDVDVGTLAARRAQLPETRQLGAAVAAEQRALLAALVPLAQRHRVAMPAVIEERRVALHQNLSILAPDMFDRAFALAMVQDYDAMLATLGDAARSGPDDLRDFAARVRPTIATRRRAAAALLSRLGGSPFNVGG